MSVTGVAIVLTVTGVTSIRNTIELENGFADVASYIQTIQNRAKNSVASGITAEMSGQFGNAAPDYYQISFANDNYSYLTCFQNISTYTCQVEESNVLSDRFSNINISTIGSDCERIAFERRTGNIVKMSNTTEIIDYNGVSSQNKTCTIRIGHINSNSYRDIVVDLEENSIETDT